MPPWPEVRLHYPLMKDSKLMFDDRGQAENIARTLKRRLLKDDKIEKENNGRAMFKEPKRPGKGSSEVRKRSKRILKIKSAERDLFKVKAEAVSLLIKEGGESGGIARKHVKKNSERDKLDAKAEAMGFLIKRGGECGEIVKRNSGKKKLNVKADAMGLLIKEVGESGGNSEENVEDNSEEYVEDNSEQRSVRVIFSFSRQE